MTGVSTPQGIQILNMEAFDSRASKHLRHPSQNGHHQKNKQQKEPSYIAGENINYCSYYGNQYGEDPLKKN